MPNPVIYPDADKDFSSQSPLILATMCVFGEARGGSYELQKAVANVIRNRAIVLCERKRAASLLDAIKYVVLAKWQFSCFNDNDPNKSKLIVPLQWERPEVWESCLEAVRTVFVSNASDNTEGATHYFVASMKVVPIWTDGATLTVVIDNTKFFRGVKW